MDVIRVRDGRPVDAVRTCSVERSPVAATSGRKKNTIGNIIASTLDDITPDTVLPAADRTFYKRNVRLRLN